MKLDPKRVPPFAQVPSEVFMDKRLKFRAVRVLGICYAHANKNTFSLQMYVSTISGLTGINHRDVQRTLRDLEKLGWIRCDIAAGRSFSSVYYVRPPRNTLIAGWNDGFYDSLFDSEFNHGVGDSPAVNQKKVVDLNIKDGCLASKNMGESPTQNILRTDKEHNTFSQPSDSSEAVREVLKDPGQVDRFLQFWQAYPKKKNPEGAMLVWKKLKPSEQLLDKMLSALKRECQSKQSRNNIEFIPLPEEWLQNRAWHDKRNVSNNSSAGSHPSHRLYKKVSPAEQSQAADSVIANKELEAMHLLLGRTSDKKVSISLTVPRAEPL